MVYNYEKGKCLPGLEVLARAAKAWGVTFKLGGCKVLPEGIEGSSERRKAEVQQPLPFLEVMRDADVEIVSVGPAGKGTLQVRLKIHFPNSSMKRSVVG
jgi:transcriptional regulator with XRE-family HTH domain